MNWNLSDETDNDLMTDGRDLSWLQDTHEMLAAASWNAAYRDVLIVGPQNELMGSAYNLSANNLAEMANRETLKSLIEAAAIWQDSDGDGLGDDWEMRFLLSLREPALGDPDRDESSHFLEYALGSDPSDAGSLPEVMVERKMDEGGAWTSFRFRRRLGAVGGLQYAVMWSGDGENWEPAGSRITLEGTQQAYDGTGTESVEYRVTGEKGMLRVEVTRVE